MRPSYVKDHLLHLLRHLLGHAEKLMTFGFLGVDTLGFCLQAVSPPNHPLITNADGMARLPSEKRIRNGSIRFAIGASSPREV